MLNFYSSDVNGNLNNAVHMEICERITERSIPLLRLNAIQQKGK